MHNPLDYNSNCGLESNLSDIIFKISIKEEIAIPIPVVNKAFSDNTGLKY